jgi:hypothetical protein
VAKLKSEVDMKKRKFADGGIFREGMQVPQDIDGASAPMKKPMAKPPMATKKPMPKKPMMPVAPKPAGTPPDASAMPAPAFKKGGSVGSASKRADGIATKGKTKGTMVAMKGGGYAC